CGRPEVSKPREQMRQYFRRRVFRDEPPAPTSMAVAKTFHEISAKLLTGEVLNFSSLKGKVVLIENVASL
uniref:Uncharacterized protein n=1 Tax=Denticeps clupeoides TaxID=299321 RepID=A0AAY4DY83_9TELE